MWKYLPALAKWITIPEPVLETIKQTNQAFHVLYIFSFKTAVTRMKLAWYKANIKQVSAVLINAIKIICNTIDL